LKIERWGSPRFKGRSTREKRPVAIGDEMMMMMMMMIIIINSNVKYTTYFTGEITLHVTQIVNTEQLQHYIP